VPDEAWPFGVYPPGGLAELGPHVTAYYGLRHPVSNSAVVRGAEATIVFDANNLADARTLRSTVDRLGGPPLSDLVLSHAHNDHAHGAMHFVPPARMWARPWARERLAHWAGRDLTPFAQEQAEFDPEGAREYTEVRIVVPEVIVDDRRMIDLGGGVRVHLRPEPIAHTPGDLWAYVEPDDVALCGDLWFNDYEPYLAHGSLRGAIDVVARLRGAGARTYLPGHGLAAVIAPAGEDMVERYCSWVMEQVDEAMGRGLTGRELQVEIRRRYDEQKERPGGIGFRAGGRTSLEVAVEVQEDAVRAG
jgi:glyoxylase-like metal-dependent hydrolase (beta-lactamase superfamily II)